MDQSAVSNRWKRVIAEKGWGEKRVCWGLTVKITVRVLGFWAWFLKYQDFFFLLYCPAFELEVEVGR